MKALQLSAIVFILHSVALPVLQGGPLDEHPHPRSAEELAKLIDRVPPWTTAGTYSRADWDCLIEVATAFQKSAPDSITSALLIFARNNTNSAKPSYLEDSKPFLLLRVLFDIPEGKQPEPSPTMGWRGDGAKFTVDGAANLAWPISWRGSAPRLIAAYRGYEGPKYDPVEDYSFFAAKFKLRDLSQYNAAGTLPFAPAQSNTATNNALPVFHNFAASVFFGSHKDLSLEELTTAALQALRAKGHSVMNWTKCAINVQVGGKEAGCSVMFWNLDSTMRYQVSFDARGNVVSVTGGPMKHGTPGPKDPKPEFPPGGVKVNP